MRLDIIGDLIAADTHRNEMLERLTRAHVQIERLASAGHVTEEVVAEARAAINDARNAAYVDGNGGPLPSLFLDAIRAVARMDLP